MGIESELVWIACGLTVLIVVAVLLYVHGPWNSKPREILPKKPEMEDDVKIVKISDKAYLRPPAKPSQTKIVLPGQNRTVRKGDAKDDK